MTIVQRTIVIKCTDAIYCVLAFVCLCCFMSQARQRGGGYHPRSVREDGFDQSWKEYMPWGVTKE